MKEKKYKTIVSIISTIIAVIIFVSIFAQINPVILLFLTPEFLFIGIVVTIVLISKKHKNQIQSTEQQIGNAVKSKLQEELKNNKSTVNCEYCGSIVEREKSNCPNCGANLHRK